MGWAEERRQRRAAEVQRWREERLGGRGQPGSLDIEDFVVLARQGTLLGGLPDVQTPAYVRVDINVAGISVRNDIIGKHLTSWAEVGAVTVETRSESRDRLASTALFGVIALGGRESDRWTDVLFHRTDGSIIAIAIKDEAPAAVRAKLAPTLASVHVPLDASPLIQAAASSGLVDELERLEDLLSRGSINAEEFAAAKRRLLGLG